MSDIKKTASPPSQTEILVDAGTTPVAAAATTDAGNDGVANALGATMQLSDAPDETQEAQLLKVLNSGQYQQFWQLALEQGMNKSRIQKLMQAQLDSVMGVGNSNNGKKLLDFARTHNISLVLRKEHLLQTLDMALRIPSVQWVREVLAMAREYGIGELTEVRRNNSGDPVPVTVRLVQVVEWLFAGQSRAIEPLEEAIDFAIECGADELLTPKLPNLFHTRLIDELTDTLLFPGNIDKLLNLAEKYKVPLTASAEECQKAVASLGKDSSKSRQVAENNATELAVWVKQKFGYDMAIPKYIKKGWETVLVWRNLNGQKIGDPFDTTTRPHIPGLTDPE